MAYCAPRLPAASIACPLFIPRCRGIAAVSFRRVSTPYWFMVRPVCRQGDLSAAPLVRLLCSDMQIRRLSPPPLLRVALRVAARTLAACPSRRIRRLSPPPVPGIAAVSCSCNAPPYRAAVSLPYHAAAMRRRIEQRYRCRIMPPQRHDPPPYQAAVSCRSNAPPYRASVSLL